MRPRFTHRFRVATVVSGPEDEVLARLAGLPSTTRVRTVSTTAGVVVTLAAGTTRAAGLAPAHAPLAPAPA